MCLASTAHSSHSVNYACINKVIEHSSDENHKIFLMLTIFREYVVHATGHVLQHKKIYSKNALFVNREVLKSLKFYPKLLTQGMIIDSFT